MKSIASLTVLLAALPLLAPAQAPAGVVRGTLLDAATGQALPYASVVLLQLPDSTAVADAQTTEAGTFALEHLKLGPYVLQANVLGYRVGRYTLRLTPAVPAVQLGQLLLRPAATQLADVVVRGERPPIVADLDKRVVNVASDLTAAGGTAADVLQNVPSVAVEQDGTVTLRGASSVTIFVDGKPSGAAGGGSGTNLSQIPASSIDRVEVLTSPSAKYDAGGTGGIINIILKKNRRDGLNGTVAAGAGTRDKYTTSLTLNYRRGKLNVFGSYDFRRDQRFVYGTRDQTITNPVTDSATGLPSAAPHVLSLHQDLDAQTYQYLHTARLGFDYSLSASQTLTLAVQPRFIRNAGTESLRSRQTDLTLSQPVYAGSSDRQSTSADHTSSADFTLDYHRTWLARPRP